MSPAGRPANRITNGAPPGPSQRALSADKRSETSARAVGATRRPRISQRRLGLVRERLSGRDRAVLATLFAVRLASGRQLRRLHYFGIGERSGRYALARLVELGLLVPSERRIGGIRGGSDGTLYQLSAAGIHVAAPKRHGRPPWPLTPRFQAHLLAICELLVGLREVERAGRVRVSVFETEPTCWRRFTGAACDRVTLKPDAFVRVDGPSYFDLFFIEADLASESPATLARKAEVYAAYYATGHEQAQAGGVFPRVVFLVPNERRRRVVAEALGTLPAITRRLFATGLLAEAPQALASEAPDDLRPAWPDSSGGGGAYE